MPAATLARNLLCGDSAHGYVSSGHDGVEISARAARVYLGSECDYCVAKENVSSRRVLSHAFGKTRAALHPQELRVMHV